MNLNKILENLMAGTLILSVLLTSFNLFPVNIYVSILNSSLGLVWYTRVKAHSLATTSILVITINLIGLIVAHYFI